MLEPKPPTTIWTTLLPCKAEKENPYKYYKEQYALPSVDLYAL